MSQVATWLRTHRSWGRPLQPFGLFDKFNLADWKGTRIFWRRRYAIHETPLMIKPRLQLRPKLSSVPAVHRRNVFLSLALLRCSRYYAICPACWHVGGRRGVQRFVKTFSTDLFSTASGEGELPLLAYTASSTSPAMSSRGCDSHE